MRKILKGLNEIVGIRGSMIVSRDGMVIASCLSRQLDEDKVAAMASNAVNSTHRALAKHGIATFSRFTLVSSHGKLVFTAAGTTYLVVVMDRNIDLGATDIELESAAMRIRAMSEIRIG